MTSTRDEVEAAAIQLTQQVHRRLSSIERFVGHSYSTARGEIALAAVAMVDRLTGAPQPDEQAARSICDGMFGDAHPPAEFWTTDLGQAVARAIGYPRPDITPTVAAAVLRCSRQNVWKMTSNGTLSLTPSLLKHLVNQSAQRRAAAAV